MSKYIREYTVKVTVIDYDAMLADYEAALERELYDDAMDALRYSEQAAREQLLMEQVEALPQLIEEVLFDDDDEFDPEPGSIVYVDSLGAAFLYDGEMAHLL